jgi:ribosomal protein L20A (L18A)
MKFEAKGTFTINGETHKFTKEIEAANEKMAKEKIYAEFGGKNGVARHYIEITEIKGAK